jgi:hypothetical protein
MSAQKELKSLAERKRLLRLEADLHRASLRAEIIRARERIEWVSQVRETITGNPLVLAGGGALAGFLALRNWRSLAKWAPAALSAWHWFRKLKSG